MKDPFMAQVLRELAATPYECSRLESFSTRDGNHVFRGHLEQKLTTTKGKIIETIIIKHTADSGSSEVDSTPQKQRQIFDISFLKALGNLQSLNDTNIVRVPELYQFNEESGTHFQEDCAETDGLIYVLLGKDSATLFPKSILHGVGYHLGSWLRAFHSWADAPEQAELRSQLPHDDPMIRVKCGFTFYSFLGVLEKFPEVLEGHGKHLLNIRDALVAECVELPTEQGWGIIHGDLWGGNILVPKSGWTDAPSPENPNKLFIIDWELAQYGHRAYDLGQIIGDMYERKVFRTRDVTLPVMEGIIDGYGPISHAVAFRVAIYVGVHLITWYQRRPKTGPAANVPRQVITDGLQLGKDFIIKGWEKDEQFFKETLLASLFTVK